MIKRKIYDRIISLFHQNKAILIFGARQTGKTTLLKSLINNISQPVLFLNGDDFDIIEMFEKVSLLQIQSLIGDYKYIFFDEAQRIRNIGIAIKIIVDNFPNVQVVATGSSVLGLSDTINEPLTGRKFEFNLYPVSFEEMVEYTDYLTEKRSLENRIIYGSYPEIVLTNTYKEKKLKSLAGSYLYKDILEFDRIKKSHVIVKLLQAIALQIGSQVSNNELAKIVGIDVATVEKYIDLLEKSFVIFRLPAYSKNYRKELKKSKKIYFCDTGIRNALIGNFSMLNLRIDKGALWENYFIAERIKYLNNSDFYGNYYFWRTQNKQEIDLIEEIDGNLYAFEIKWGKKLNYRFPVVFKNNYPDTKFQLVNSENYYRFLRD